MHNPFALRIILWFWRHLAGGSFEENQCLLKSAARDTCIWGDEKKSEIWQAWSHTEDYSGQAKTTWDDCVNISQDEALRFHIINSLT